MGGGLWVIAGDTGCDSLLVYRSPTEHFASTELDPFVVVSLRISPLCIVSYFYSKLGRILSDLCPFWIGCNHHTPKISNPFIHTSSIEEL